MYFVIIISIIQFNYFNLLCFTAIARESERVREKTLKKKIIIYYIMTKINGLNIQDNIFAIIVSIVLLIYLYLDTPVPARLMLNNYFLLLAIVVIVFIFYYLLNKVNVFVALLFALVAFEVVRKSMKPDEYYIDKRIQYYDAMSSTSDAIISQKLTNQEITLEQEMVNLMNQVGVANEHPRTSPRYQPIVANLAGSSQLD